MDLPNIFFSWSFCFFVLRFCNRDRVARPFCGIGVLSLTGLNSPRTRTKKSHMLITCWSHVDHMTVPNPGHVFFQNFASEVLQLRNIVYNNKKYFVFFSMNINFFFKKITPENYRGDSDLLLSGARMSFLSVVEKEKS